MYSNMIFLLKSLSWCNLVSYQAYILLIRIHTQPLCKSYSLSIFLSMLTKNCVNGLINLPKNELWKMLWANSIISYKGRYFWCDPYGWRSATFLGLLRFLLYPKLQCLRLVRKRFFTISPFIFFNYFWHKLIGQNHCFDN